MLAKSALAPKLPTSPATLPGPASQRPATAPPPILSWAARPPRAARPVVSLGPQPTLRKRSHAASQQQRSAPSSCSVTRLPCGPGETHGQPPRRGAGAGVSPGRCPPSPRPTRCVRRAGAPREPSLLPGAAHTMLFATRGKVVLCGFRVSGGNSCAPTGDSAGQLLPGAEAAAAPPRPCPERGAATLSLRRPRGLGRGRLCSDIFQRSGRRVPEAAAAILEKGADAARPPSWQRVSLGASGVALPRS